MSTYAVDNPQTDSGIGGAAPAPATLDWSQFYLPFSMGGLPGGPPADAHVDAQYLANEAQNRAGIERQYGDYLSQLGYTDPATGQFIPGSLIQDAQLVQANAEQQRQQAIEQTTQAMQNAGTLFSGYRGHAQALAEQPYVQQIADSIRQLPKDMADVYGKAAGLVGQYTIQNNLDLADAAARYAATQQANPATTGGTTTDGSTAQRPVDQGFGPSGQPPGGTDYTNTFEGIPTGPSGTYWGYAASPGGRATVPQVTYMAGGGEVDQPTNAIVGEAGPEAVVPRSGLTQDENDQLSGLLETAHARLGGGLRRNPVGPGIHWFGPGGSGVDYPPENPLGGIYEGRPPLPVSPVHFPPVQLHPPLAQWISRHPAAMAGRAPVPHWAQVAMAAQQRLRSHPGFPVHLPNIPIQMPPVGIPAPGFTPS